MKEIMNLGLVNCDAPEIIKVNMVTRKDREKIAAKIFNEPTICKVMREDFGKAAVQKLAARILNEENVESTD